MNRYVLLCQAILKNPATTQRDLSSLLDLSLGTINKLISDCLEQNYIEIKNKTYFLTEAGLRYLKPFQVDNAIILAAGFGSRFVPLTFETPKGLLKVFDEPMIERQIKQLHEVGILDITVVVGYLKESFEYLIDKYNVTLLYNPEYKTKNTLATLYHGKHLLKNTYILCSDNWIKDNIFHPYEAYPWYTSAFMNGSTSEWCLSTDKKNKITSVEIGGHDSYVMYGPAYFTKDFSLQFIDLLEPYYHKPGTESYYWEQIVKDQIQTLPMYSNPLPDGIIHEFESLEELRLFDSKYRDGSDNAALECISRIFHVPERDIKDIQCLKAGMTNKSFRFTIKDVPYIFRIPGPGTDILLNRKEEKASYEAIAPLDIAEPILYFDSDTGFKVTKYYIGSRNADRNNQEDIQSCLQVLKNLHSHKIMIEHSFDIRERIAFHEALCKKHNGILFADYDIVRQQMNHLLDHLDSLNIPKQLSHVDSAFENFLILEDGSVRLIDWEYSGMCDPLTDLSMCSIYSHFSIEETDFLMKTYFDRTPTEEEKIRIYSYMALGGFLWALWAEYRTALGEEFGEYIITMYRYAKKYSKIVQSMLK